MRQMVGSDHVADGNMPGSGPGNVMESVCSLDAKPETRVMLMDSFMSGFLFELFKQKFSRFAFKLLLFRALLLRASQLRAVACPWGGAQCTQRLSPRTLMLEQAFR